MKGTHKKDMLIKFLDKFIEKFVLCPKCKYPELTVSLEGKKVLAFKCNACPETGKLDTTSKAGGFMLKNPDKLFSSVDIKTGTAGKVEKKPKKKTKEEEKGEETIEFKKPAVDSDEISKLEIR